MGKRTVYTNITPLPENIPRQLVIDMLHNHGEIIELNPLVLEHYPINAPRQAASDEYFSTWYEIVERIQYVPGMGNLGSGKVSFKGVFHDMPWGLQTHVYASAGVNIRNKWQVRGNQPGEPPEVREIGDTAPRDGLYLREDIDITCNRALISFVKKELVAATGVLVQRLLKKAELLDDGTLKALWENGKLTTVDPVLPPELRAAQSFSNQLAIRGQRESWSSSLSPYPDHDSNEHNGPYTPEQMSSTNSQDESPSRPGVFELEGSDVANYPPPTSSPRFQSPGQFEMPVELPGSSPTPTTFYHSGRGDSKHGNVGLGIMSDTSSHLRDTSLLANYPNGGTSASSIGDNSMQS